MSSTSRRLWGIGVCYGLGLLVVAAHLGNVMLIDHDEWLVRSYQNRWAFRDVPSVRGALLDRSGNVLVDDEPTFELECVYERFRLRHPVGAAIHAATLASAAAAGATGAAADAAGASAADASAGDVSGSVASDGLPAGEARSAEVRYRYLAGELGPEAALADLLRLPVAQVLASPLPKAERRELLGAVLTVLCAISERDWSRVRSELRECAESRPATALGDALPGTDREQLAAQFAAILARLRALDRALADLEAARRQDGTGDEDDDDPDAGAESGRDAGAAAGLLARLERFRIDCLQQRRTQRRLPDGSIREGELLERLARPVLRRVPFELAAALRVAADDQPGLRLEPSLQRRRIADLPPSLGQLIGSVRSLDQSPGPASYLEDRVEAALGLELDELVPDDLSPVPHYRQALLQQAVRSYERVLRTRERRGTGGIESMLDRELAGAPGLRLVEHDARAREQLLWSSLRVAPGADVMLTVDLELQRLLDRLVAASAARWQQVAVARGSDPRRIDVAMAIVDARSGDVLALAGAPTTLDDLPRLPAMLNWRGNGALGSIVKPLFLVEQLIAERLDFPHADLAALQECAQTYKGKDGRTYRCDHAHWAAGADPVAALAESCNTFFFQVAEALGEPGLRRALWRFGLLPAPAGGGDGRYQPRPDELPAGLCAAPRWLPERQYLPMRGIGYSLCANPLSMARAYSALATGLLPVLSLRRGGLRPAHPIGVTADELALVQQGLRDCTERGTADEIGGLAEFGVHGKTGTAGIALDGKEANNAWFAGYLPLVARGGVQWAFCAVVYAVPDRIHGADAAGLLVADVLRATASDPVLAGRYLEAAVPEPVPEGGR